ncbi:MAG: winged helix DNA-binding domain-containing protein, partial [Thermoleophilaceae bacterium]|nr:winged helix DNA-binding domain-containing protein [Thermoleophilaceae bacterium]
MDAVSLARDVRGDGERWLSEAWRDVLAVLSDGRQATSSELRAEIPSLEGAIAYGQGKSWGGQVP